ncbi:hypothetical protein CBR_g3317 [Chara braunii]|uniref:Uncharacterized protein n=1 Tax=Chara braunii TaxID=69332 RepID=A0A388KFI7_CHABU|nr:hypothetical protein CBR_g3317 [Chara braunii]|eukprot:GBG68777.1 hypothetical protein CBR_g3317 [Chara braunii]
MVQGSMASSYVQATQSGMTEGDKRMAAKVAREARESMASQGTSISGRDSSQPRALGQRVIDFLIEKTKITPPIKITKETHKSQDGKEEEVDVWEYPEQDIPSLHELYGRHAALFNFASKSRDLPLNEKRRWVMERLRGLESIPGVEPEVSYHQEGEVHCDDCMSRPLLCSISPIFGVTEMPGKVVTIQAWKPPRPPQAEASQHRQKMMKEHFWVQFDNISEGMDSFVQKRLSEEYQNNAIIDWLSANPDFLTPNHDSRVACLEGGTGVLSPLGEQMETSQQEDSGLTPSKEQEMEEATGQEEVGTDNEKEFSEGKSASSAIRLKREGEGGEGEEGEESEESSSEDGWEDAEDEQEEKPETLERWVKCVQALE